MVLEEHRVVVIREDVAADPHAVDPLVEHPPRRRALVHAHDAEREGLSLGLRLPDHVIHQTEVVLPLTRLEFVPRPAEVGDGLGGYSPGGGGFPQPKWKSATPMPGL